MNRTGVQLAAIDRRLRHLVQQPHVVQDTTMDHVIADCRHKLDDLRRQFRAFVATELKVLPTSSVLHTRLSQWLMDEMPSMVASIDPTDEDAEFSTLDGFLLVEDVALLDQFVHQVAQSIYKLNATAAAASATGAFLTSPSATAVVDNPTLVS
ncbi:hypothetical protein DYB25_010544 [Aphanomyces astaci]|uniref:Uncharacterized protein n=1 Tax=Aphanomyces astaci TaxID=112090 RepID=A0A397AFS8_APHAT|nr:hypothetical protein DYB25_010544 [Aphanomyces astaci]RHY08044.1 hypothetical protein DYB36_002801 [Aphanomyces astaci]RHY50976.1 hypothetical protein DYB38_006855 [Aphanomyces astaci]RHY52565.1 hypothetical protein DYB34_004482 [Aphanomyces astaci]RHY61477.1 hypothetical protein DYB30_000749 [Aphanomyces astaci]